MSSGVWNCRMKTLRKYCKVSDYKTPMNKRNKKGDMLKHVPPSCFRFVNFISQ